VARAERAWALAQGRELAGPRRSLELDYGSCRDIRLVERETGAPVVLIESHAGDVLVTSARGARETCELAGRAIALRARRWTPL
jgi:hypothetical protein